MNNVNYNQVTDINENSSYVQLIPNCNSASDNIISQEENMPKVKNEAPEQGIPATKPGIKGPISIVKVRKIAWESLCRALIFNATEASSPQTTPNIYINTSTTGNDTIISLATPNNGSEDFNLTKLGNVFNNANIDETEDNDNESKKTSGLSRKNLSDSNQEMKLVDTSILKIISILFLFYKGDVQNLKTKAKNILYSFIVTSSVKEYLDIGQLYALLTKIINESSSQDVVMETNSSGNESSSSSQTITYERAMLETIDGAATRIAANGFCASYCNFILEDNFLSSKINCGFYIDNIDVYKICMALNLNKKQLLANNVLQTANLSIEASRNNQYDIDNNTRNSSRNIAINEISVLFSDANIIVPFEFFNQPVIIDKFTYYLVSQAFFDKKFKENTREFANDLLKCNFDSLCHDNGESKIYRLIMILTFILKNNEDEILKELLLMFPSAFLGFSQNTTLINESFNLIKTKTYSGLETNIDYIIDSLTENQQFIFKLLTTKNASQVEDGLYLRLFEKSCYVFSALDSDKMAIVPLKSSAHDAFEPARSSIDTDEDILGIRAINQGVIIPEYTQCVIDAPLKHGLSLSNYELSRVNSKVVVTSVTRNDAAAQNMLYSEPYTLPICMAININTFLPDNNLSVFAYNFIYGKNVLSETTEGTIYCKNSQVDIFINNKGLCDKYNKILKFLNATNFYVGSGGVNIEQKKQTVEVLIGLEIEKLCNVTIGAKYNVSRVNIRQNLSKLNETICYSKKTNKKEALRDGKLAFTKFLIDYVKTPTNGFREELINTTYKILLLSTYNLDNLLTNLNNINRATLIDANQSGLITENLVKNKNKFNEEKIIADNNVIDLKNINATVKQEEENAKVKTVKANATINDLQRRSLRLSQNLGRQPGTKEEQTITQNPKITLGKRKKTDDVEKQERENFQKNIKQNNDIIKKENLVVQSKIEQEILLHNNITEAEIEKEEKEKALSYQEWLYNIFTRLLGNDKQKTTKIANITQEIPNPLQSGGRAAEPREQVSTMVGLPEPTASKPIEVTLPNPVTKSKKMEVLGTRQLPKTIAVTTTDAKGITDVKTKPDVNMSYTSMFGKYGFYMYLNDDGMYVLKILNTQEDYNDYTKKYDIKQTKKTVKQTTIEGGKNRTKRNKNKVRKHKYTKKNNKNKSNKNKSNKNKILKQVSRNTKKNY